MSSYCDELTCFECPCTKHSPKSQNAFLEWLRSNGSQLKVELKDTWCGRGVFATEDVEEGRPLLTIPRKLLVTVDAGAENSSNDLTRETLGRAVESVHVDGLLLVRALLHQRQLGATSFWKPFFDVLPQEEDFSYHPLTWSTEQMEGLQATSQPALIEQQKDMMKQFYHSLTSSFEDSYSFEVFQWAFLTIHTRAANVPINGSLKFVLIPLGDMLNHAAVRNTDWGFNDSGDHVFINAGTGGVRKGEEIFLSYYENGLETHSADQWLRSYGFVPENNEVHDTLYLYVGVVPGDPSFGAKYSQLAGNNSGLFRLSMDSTALCTKRLFSFLRYKFQVGALPSERVKATELDIDPISVENELDVLEYLSSYCSGLLENFTTSMDEDMKLKCSSDPIARNCAAMRISDRIVASYYVAVHAALSESRTDTSSFRGPHEQLFRAYHQAVWEPLMRRESGKE